MKYHIQGKAPVDLTQKDFLAQGGEGSVYRRAGTAFKVYNDPKKMIAVGKIQELQALTHSNIIKPEDVLLDAKSNSPVGYTMRYVKDTYSLCQLFTKAFRDRNKITPDMALVLVRKLQELITHVHSKSILVVDLNELNFLASDDFKEIYAIDVDSYQTRSFPATAIMESIRDRHSKTFSELTDWFSFAIVSFQMFIGIHPYKGKHAKLKSMEERMIHNVTVFDKDVGIPAVCYPFSVIPQVYLDWYKAVLESGKRLPPPTDLHATVAVIMQTVNKIVGSNNFDMQEIGTYDGEIVGVLFVGGDQIVQTSKTLHLSSKEKTPVAPNSQIVITPKMGIVVAASVQRGQLHLYNASSRTDIPVSIEANFVMEYDGRLYAKSRTHMLEIRLMEDIMDRKILVSSTPVANVLESATRVYDGVVFQNLLGACYMSTFPSPGSHNQVRIKELDDYRILDAKFEANVLMVVGFKGGKYDRLILRFDNQDYDVRVIPDITPVGLNFVVLDSGVCVSLTEEENVEIFSAKKDSKGANLIDDPSISGDMKFFKHGAKVMVARGNRLYSMTMKKRS